ncbi:uncharacterized protein LOC144013547 [Festucalex cinctus]
MCGGGTLLTAPQTKSGGESKTRRLHSSLFSTSKYRFWRAPPPPEKCLAVAAAFTGSLRSPLKCSQGWTASTPCEASLNEKDSTFTAFGWPPFQGVPEPAEIGSSTPATLVRSNQSGRWMDGWIDGFHFHSNTAQYSVGLAKSVGSTRGSKWPASVKMKPESTVQMKICAKLDGWTEGQTDGQFERIVQRDV